MNSRYLITIVSALLVNYSGPANAEGSILTHSPTGSSCFELAGVYEMDFLGFYATDEEAIRAAAEVDEHIFKVEVREAATGPEWVVRAVYRDLPTAESHARQAEYLRIIGAKHGSIFGFGCAYRKARR